MGAALNQEVRTAGLQCPEIYEGRLWEVGTEIPGRLREENGRKVGRAEVDRSGGHAACWEL